MKVLMSCSGGYFDLVRYPKKWLVVASTMVRAEVRFWQWILLKKLKSILKLVPGYIFYVDTLE